MERDIIQGYGAKWEEDGNTAEIGAPKLSLTPFIVVTAAVAIIAVAKLLFVVKLL